MISSNKKLRDLIFQGKIVYLNNLLVVNNKKFIKKNTLTKYAYNHIDECALSFKVTFYKNDEIIEFDIIKISHHGSLKNNFEWIEKLYSKKYIVSTNGKSHGHPHKEVLAKILQNNFKQKEFYFNYPIRLKEELEKEELQEIYNYSVEFGDGKSILKIEVNNK